jgi:hypothetical protein
MSKDKKWFDDKFTDDVPADLKKLVTRICMSYNIDGICDPNYLANIIALELGFGDGHSNFHRRN